MSLIRAAVPDAVKNIRCPTAYGSPPVETYAHYAVTVLRRYLVEELGRQPTIAVLARENAFLGRLSENLGVDSSLGQHELPAIDHDLVFDVELSAAAGYVVASILGGRA